MTDAESPVGLYSIGIKGLTMPELLAWAASVQIPFLHLRGGARGHGVLERSRRELEHWRETARALCPITVVTSDVTLAELTSAEPRTRSAARAALDRMADSAAVLGVGRVRVLADKPATVIGHAPLLPGGDISLLIEPHHHSWWTAPGLNSLEALASSDPRIRLLADTAQAAAGLASHSPADARGLADRVIALSDVLHLSDDGSGLGATGHTVLARAACASGQLEIGFEWTGQLRSAQACLQRYTAACAWWRGLVATPRAQGES
ncbi:hypothetical protein KGQ19_12825 [Catenulispora sp. NL8]|uniref:Xylose isomerase domain protein TIM barrel n=1 Tax=Catenulispora pinistramenti TaxID=2705254 RepID=A0ABS5KNZ0_9ACTN|nr:hypothetical protein [Catenulispora pinistramenti]MBS2547751.1 hypothetical protein [Catenulispora pinistramenti]